MKTYSSPAKYASISEMLSEKASEPFWGKALRALAQFKISSSIALALVLFFAVSVGAVTLTAYTEMTNSGLVYEAIPSAGQSGTGKVLGVASYGYNQPNCNRGNCLNHTLIGFEREGWRVEINYLLQPGVVGGIKVNGWPFMDNLRGSGLGQTGYDLEPGEDYNFILYRKNGRRLTKLVSLNLTAPEKPERPPVCPLRPLRQGCTLDYSQDECGVEVCEVNQVCDYPAPPQNCTYVPGMNFNPETQCGLELRCNNPTPSYGYMGHLTFKENTNTPITNPVPADSAMATLANIEVVSEIVMDVGSFSHQINSLTFEAKPNEALQNIENAYLYNGPILLAKAKVLGRIYCTMGSSCPSSSEMVFDLNPPLNIAMGKNSVLTIKGDVAGSASGSIALRPITYSIVPGTTYPTDSNGLRAWWSQSIAFTPSRGPVCPTIDIMCRDGETVVWDENNRQCRVPRCVPQRESAKLLFTSPVASAILAKGSNQIIAWEASANISRVSLKAEAQFMPTCLPNTSCAQVLPQYEIVKFQNNPGRYEWKVGQYLGGDNMPEGKYKLRIEGYKTNGELLTYDLRESVIGSELPTINPSISVSNLRVTDQILIKGQTYRFKWESNGIEKMYIWLFKKTSGNQVVYWISDVAKNNNYLDWAVPTNLPDGNDYYARVTGYANGGDAGKAETGVFSIQSGIIACVPPPPITCRENQTTVWREENGCRVSGGCVDLHPTTPPLPPIVYTPNTGTNVSGGSAGTAGAAQSQYPTYRYVKIETPSSNSWVAWREIEVYDDAGQKLAISSATATSEYRDSVTARAYDGNINTVWNSGSYNNASITIDLGAEKKVSKIRVLPANFPNPASTTHYVRGKSASDISFKDLTTFGGLIKDNEWREYQLEKR
jgi:hypothetical protein